MIWQDEGYLLSKRKFRENANIVNVFTNSFGKVSGIVYGGNSRKVRNYLQISNKIFVFYNNKNENKIGYFKTELMQAISPKYFNDKTKTSALLSLTSLLNSLLPEAQSYKNIYLSLDNFINELNNEKWIFSYIDWELKLIRELDGYLSYELPQHLLGIIWKGKYRGQKQKWFVMKFLGEDNEINIKTKSPEFLEWKWLELNKITDVVVDFKLNVYRKVKEKVNKILVN